VRLFRGYHQCMSLLLKILSWLGSGNEQTVCVVTNREAEVREAERDDFSGTFRSSWRDLKQSAEDFLLNHFSEQINLPTRREHLFRIHSDHTNHHITIWIKNESANLFCCWPGLTFALSRSLMSWTGMAEIDVLKAQVVRDSPSVAWGLTLQGGSVQPLSIYRVSETQCCSALLSTAQYYSVLLMYGSVSFTALMTNTTITARCIQ